MSLIDDLSPLWQPGARRKAWGSLLFLLGMWAALGWLAWIIE